METKICNRCGLEKPITEFCYRKREKQYRNPCKECRNKYLREYSKQHSQELKEYRDNYYQNNKEEKLKYQKQYSINNKEKISTHQKKYREEHHEEIHNYKVNYYKENKDAVSEKNRNYYFKNSNTIKEYNKKYAKENREKINQYIKDRKSKDTLFKLKLQVRNMLWESFNRKGNKKNYSGEKLLGCKWEYFINHLLETYKDRYGYEWDGKEDVHIDHIVPLATAKSEKEIIELCNYTNLQLLKGKDNLEKGAKIDWEE